MDESLVFFGATSASHTDLIDWNMWMAFATAIAAFFTAWNVWETRKAVKISNDALNLNKRPYLSFNGPPNVEFYTGQTPISTIVRIPIKNVGQVPLMYEIKQMLMNNKPLVFTSEKIGLFPGNDTYLYTPHFPLSAEQTTARFGFEVRIQCEYWPPNRHERYQLARTFVMKPHPNGSGAWIDYKSDLLE